MADNWTEKRKLLNELRGIQKSLKDIDCLVTLGSVRLDMQWKNPEDFADQDMVRQINNLRAVVSRANQMTLDLFN